MKKWKNPELYSYKYKQHLPWSKAMWIVQPGDRLLVDDTISTVKAVTLKPVLGAVPEIILESDLD